MRRDYEDLTPEAQKDRDDFEATFGSDGNCSCHLSPPCSSCIHSGNPINQYEDDTAWLDKEDEIVSIVTKAMS